VAIIRIGAPLRVVVWTQILKSAQFIAFGLADSIGFVPTGGALIGPRLQHRFWTTTTLTTETRVATLRHHSDLPIARHAISQTLDRALLITAVKAVAHDRTLWHDRLGDKMIDESQNGLRDATHIPMVKVDVTRAEPSVGKRGKCRAT